MNEAGFGPWCWSGRMKCYRSGAFTMFLIHSLTGSCMVPLHPGLHFHLSQLAMGMAAHLSFPVLSGFEGHTFSRHCNSQDLCWDPAWNLFFRLLGSTLSAHLLVILHGMQLCTLKTIFTCIYVFVYVCTYVYIYSRTHLELYHRSEYMVCEMSQFPLFCAHKKDRWEMRDR